MLAKLALASPELGAAQPQLVYTYIQQTSFISVVKNEQGIKYVYPNVL
jgi:hypothetical protein